jgi:hypothetical protein
MKVGIPTIRCARVFLAAPIIDIYEADEKNLIYIQRTREEEYNSFLKNVKGITTFEDYDKQRTIV